MTERPGGGDAGNTRATASPLVIGTVVSGRVGFDGDVADWFTFDLTARGVLNLRLGGLSQDIDLVVFDVDGFLKSSDEVGRRPEQITLIIEAGTYEVLVEPFAGDYGPSAASRYRLATSIVPEVLGEAGSDTLRGDGGVDFLSGADGDDHISGSGGDDTLSGDGGRDTLRGDDGADWLRGGSDHDLLQGGAGEDKLNGQSGADTVNGGDDRDRLRGGGGSDLLLGQGGSDYLNGEVGDDSLYGGADFDYLAGD